MLCLRVCVRERESARVHMCERLEQKSYAYVYYCVSESILPRL